MGTSASLSCRQSFINSRLEHLVINTMSVSHYPSLYLLCYNWNRFLINIVRLMKWCRNYLAYFCPCYNCNYQIAWAMFHIFKVYKTCIFLLVNIIFYIYLQLIIKSNSRSINEVTKHNDKRNKLIYKKRITS